MRAEVGQWQNAKITPTTATATAQYLAPPTPTWMRLLALMLSATRARMETEEIQQ